MYIFRQIITSALEANILVAGFRKDKPKVCAFDTETTGLHLTQDQPFIFQCGWLSNDQQTMAVFGIDLQQYPKLGRQVIKAWHTLVQEAEIYLAHNTKYDLHMLANWGEPYTTENLSDTQFYIRYAHDALSPDRGGPPLGLKDYCAQYIDRNAKNHEKLLDTEKTAIAKHWNSKLRQAMGWKASKLDAFLKDITSTLDDLTSEEQQILQTWRASLPPRLAERNPLTIDSAQVPYDLLNRAVVLEYALEDIVLTLKCYMKLAPIVDVRGNTEAIKLENSLIIPLWEMERVGFKIDIPYLQQAERDMREYIKERRNHLYALAGEPISIGQHARIRTLLRDRLDVDVATTNKEELARTESDLRSVDPTHPAVDFIATLQELRTLEKWYATYILRFLSDLKRSDHLHTQINQVGTVSGRVTSDFQQFPKDPIKTVDGRIIFWPRQMVQIEGGDYDGLIYLDYSQIELRVQAMYTILVGHPEPNLIGAYAPYGYVNGQGERFDPTRPDHVRAWAAPWYKAEDPTQLWQALDVHAATTCYAFDITPDHPDFKKLRYHGKRINFAKNYGAQFKRIKQMFPEYDDERIGKINDSYYKAFPGVRAYHDYCYRLADAKPYATNLFGVRYYNVSGHNLINMLVQGSSAFFLKWKIRQLYEFSKAHNIQSKFQMNIHDELSWLKHKDESEVFFQFKELMEAWEDSLIPIVAEMEFSRTTWAEKKGVHSVEDLWLRNE